MKKWIGFICHIILIGFMTSFATFSENSDEKGEGLSLVPSSLRVCELNEVLFPTETSEAKTHFAPKVLLDNAYLGFKEALAFKESQGKYLVVNTLGYMGKYQFGANTLKLMGVENTDAFMKDPGLQEQLFNMNVARNKWILRREIKRFQGKRIKGTVITESGIIAAAHLAGAGNVKKYLHSYGRQDFADAYGSNIAYYIKKFGGFDISTVAPEHNPRI